MNDRLTTLLHDKAARFDVRPSSPGQVRRDAQHKRAVRRSAAAVLAVTAVVIVAVFVGSNPLSGARHNDIPAIPGPTPSLLTLAPAPFLTDADLTGWQVRRATSTETPRLTSCLTDPRAWGASQTESATYGPTRPGNSVVESILRFGDGAAAHRAFLDAWTQMKRCPAPANGIRDGLGPLPDAGAMADEYFAAERAWFKTAAKTGQPVGMYAIRIARINNVIVVIEDTGTPSDRPEYMLTIALVRAVRGYLATHRDNVCFYDKVDCFL